MSEEFSSGTKPQTNKQTNKFKTVVALQLVSINMAQPIKERSQWFNRSENKYM